MVEVYDSYEQSEIVKKWLKENGSAIVLGLALAFGGLFGIKQWQGWQVQKHQRASAEYEVMTALLASGNLDAAVANYETLKAEFADSAYTALASLNMARARNEAGQADLAAQMLESAMKGAQPEAVRLIARARLARLKLHLGEPDEALRLIDSAPSDDGFEAQFAEIRGDIAHSRGDLAKAARYYAEALDMLEDGTGNRAYLEVKLQSVQAETGGTGETS